MSEMIDRVAMALKQVWQSGDKNPEYGELARAAIEAMRDPTPDMAISGLNAIVTWREANAASGPGATAWHAMIDAALASNEPQAG
jgi:hypothetical protein